jgi:YqaJ-like viral recombinase domain.
MSYESVEQNTEAWRLARAGKVTASRVADVVAKGRAKGSWGQAREKYMAQLIAERLTGMPAENFYSVAAQWGHDHEEEALSAYSLMTDVDVARIGFVTHPRVANAGASPDALVGGDGLAQVKCPAPHTHIATVMRGEIDPAYVTQMQWELSSTDRLWCDYVSYDPRLPPDLRLFVKRVGRDQERIDYLEARVREFNEEVEAMIAAMREAV